MNDVEVLNDKLKSFEDPEDIKKFVLYCFKKDKNLVEKWRHNQRIKKYECKDNQKNIYDDNKHIYIMGTARRI